MGEGGGGSVKHPAAARLSKYVLGLEASDKRFTVIILNIVFCIRKLQDYLPFRLPSLPPFASPLLVQT